jgi:beta-glucosidase
LHLPGAQDELVRRVLAANPRCAVVVNTGSPVAMPWIDDAPAVVLCGLGGQEMAPALVDVLTGAREPAGRLPTTYPVRVEDNPAYLDFPGELAELCYRESIFVGYRWYEARAIAPLFPFGHGMSYTTFAIGEPVPSTPTYVPGAGLEVRVPVRNTGHRRGAVVLQCYVEPVGPRVRRPPKELKAFAKLWLEAGDETVARLQLDDRSFAYWFPGDALPLDVDDKLRMPLVRHVRDDTPPGWRIDPGRYRLHVGRSSLAIDHVVEIDVAPPR